MNLSYSNTLPQLIEQKFDLLQMKDLEFDKDQSELLFFYFEFYEITRR